MRWPVLACLTLLAGCPDDEPAATVDAAPEPDAEAVPDADTRELLRLTIVGDGEVEVFAGAQPTTCSTSCEIAVAPGESPNLVAHTSAGVVFQGWESCVLNRGDSCIADNDREVTAHFARLTRSPVVTFGDEHTDFLADLAVGPDGAPVVAVGWYETQDDASIVSYAKISKLDATTGTAVWEREIHSNSPNVPGSGLDVDAAGDVYLTGETLSALSAGGLDLPAGRFVAKLDAATGEPLWISPTVAAGAVVVDTPDGDAITCGARDSGIHVARLAGSDGQVVWTRKVTEGDDCTGLAVGGDKLAVASYGSNGLELYTGLTVVDLATGDEAYAIDLSAPEAGVVQVVHNPAGRFHAVINSQVETRLVAFAAESGAELFSQPLAMQLGAWDLVMDGERLVGLFTGRNQEGLLGPDWLALDTADAVLLELSPATGEVTRARRVTGDGEQIFGDLAASPKDDSLWLGGGFYASWSIDGQELPSAGGFDVFVLRAVIGD